MNYYTNIIKDLKLSNPSQWYSKLKRICSYDQEKYEPIMCSEIENHSDEEQAEKIASFFARPRQKYDELSCDIVAAFLDKNSFPQFTQTEVQEKLKQINTKKSVPENDIPPKILKEFATEIAIPLTDLINSSIIQGV